ncbi:hypothetical protein [Cereibacter johrii]|uniref:hypothetical protein n=1 Tax=Cereibacter johrii TaxID=445629 RepID=UPI0011BF6809|nr:hypothetical protein [Cereibacter johrii]
MAIAPDTLVLMLETLARLGIESFEHLRAIADPRSPEAVDAEIRREAATQEVLRRALALGDRAAAAEPLRHVANELGILLDEADPDYKVLAHQANRVLLDLSRERMRRHNGDYEQPTIFFRSVMRVEGRATPDTLSPAPSAWRAATLPVTPFQMRPETASKGKAAGACDRSAFGSSSSLEAGPEPHEGSQIPATQRTSPATGGPDRAGSGSAPATFVCGSDSGARQQERTAIVPAGLILPEGMDIHEAERARIAARPPRIHVDRSKLSEGARAALAKPRGITLPEAIDLFFELRGMGYGTEFDRPQSLARDGGKAWRKENRSNERLAKSFWAEVLGEGPVDEIEFDAVSDALTLLWRVPKHHNRGRDLTSDRGYLDLIERCDAVDAEVEAKAAEAARKGATAEDIDRVRIDGLVERLKAGTYVKHGRVMGAIGKMLMDTGANGEAGSRDIAAIGRQEPGRQPVGRRAAGDLGVTVCVNPDHAPAGGAPEAQDAAQRRELTGVHLKCGGEPEDGGDIRPLVGNAVPCKQQQGGVRRVHPVPEDGRDASNDLPVQRGALTVGQASRSARR